MSLRGSYSARIDDKSRLKVPADFRRVIESTWGSEVFVTSLTGKDALVYPLPIWEEFEARLMSMPLMQPARMRIQRVVNFYGQAQSIDSQGRVLVHSPLKEEAGMTGDVTVLGYGNHLSVNSRDRLVEALRTESIEADLQTLSDLWRNE